MVSQSDTTEQLLNCSKSSDRFKTARILLTKSGRRNNLRTQSRQKRQDRQKPYEKIWGRKPKKRHLKVCGCLAYVKNRKREKSKFDPETRKHVFLAYDSNSTAYLLQDIETRKLTRARNVVFNERKVVGFTNEPTEAENDVFFDVTFEHQNEAENSQNVVKIDIKEECFEIVKKFEVLVDEES